MPALTEDAGASGWPTSGSGSPSCTAAEWTSSGAGPATSCYLVQARPITTAVPDGAGQPARPLERQPAGDFLWTNTNVGEAIPDVMTPATWSMVQVFLPTRWPTASIPPYVGYGRIGGRIYLNVSRDGDPARRRRGQRAASSGP